MRGNRHLNLIAAVIKEVDHEFDTYPPFSEDFIPDLVKRFADACEKNYPNFRREFFYKRCGIIPND